ncbi:MAG: PepSY domain-containing protein [Planctomycetota bacterium]|nr:PepSY domain-containing protein [Planctomycetota bacterium]
MNTNVRWPRALCAMLVCGVLGLSVRAGEGEGKEEKLALKDVPEAVLKAAQEAVKGIVFDEAEKKTRGETVVYELEGKAGEKRYEVKVSADGKVLKVEEDDDDDGDDDKNEKDDD